MKLRTLLAAVCLALSFSILHAQESKFRYRADIPKVDSNGVYKLLLQPGFTAKCTDKGLYDIRLADEGGKFIAYTIVNTPMDRSSSIFIPFPEVKQDHKTDTVTTYIVDARAKNEISELWLKLKSNEVTRMASLSGSDDLQRWFAIKEGIELDGDQSGSNTEYEQQLIFPASKYRYYRVRISNKASDPLQITGAGIYIASSQMAQVVSVTGILKPEVKQGNRKTSYFINLGDDFQVDALVLHMSSPKYYTRLVTIYDVGHKRGEQLHTDSISSGRQNSLSFSAKTNRIRIDVANGDDTPLVITGVDVLQQAKFAIAYLEKGHQYHLLAGDSTANEVSYDLTFLHSKPMSKIHSLGHSPVYKNPAYITRVFNVKRDYTQLIWTSIAVVLVLLSLLTWRMVKELGTK